MTREKPKHKRIYLINRDFQLRYTRAAIGVGILSTILTASVVLYPLYAFGILRVPAFLPFPIMVAMGFAALMNICCLAFMGVFISHRVAGPMYSLVRAFRSVGEGRLGVKLRSRDDDDMKFVVRNFNEMTELLSLTCKEEITELEGIMDLVDSLDCSEKKEIHQKIHDLKERYKVRLSGDLI